MNPRAMQFFALLHLGARQRPPVGGVGPRMSSSQWIRVRGVAVALVAVTTLSACVVAPPRHRGVYAPEGRAVAPPPPPIAQAPVFFYPERGQPEAQQERDRFECYRWAVSQSGIDPGMTPVRQAAHVPAPLPPQRDGSQVVGGAATGAIIGAATSGTRHVGEHALIGAIFGAMLGAVAQEHRAQAVEAAHARRQAAAEAANAAAQVPMDGFRRAMGACMNARGYRVG